MKPCKPEDTPSRLEQIIGLGEKSVRKNYYPQLRENAEQVKRFRALLDYTNDWVILLSVTPFQVSDVNETVCQFFSLKSRDIVNGGHREYLRNHPESSFSSLLKQLKELTQHDMEDGLTQELSIIHNQETLWLEVTCRLAQFEGASFITVVGRDISERKNHQQALQRLLGEKEALLDNALVGLAWVKNRIILSCNRKLEKMMGYAHGEVAGLPTRVLYENQQAYDELGEDAYKQLGNGHAFTKSIKLARKDGSYSWCELTGNAIDPTCPDDGSVWIFSDVHEHIMNQEKAQFMALHDPLTELPNLKLLQQHFSQFATDTAQAKSNLAALCLDLDKFKNINDLLGFSESNKLLIDVANRLKNTIGEQGYVSRQGGDEFNILLPNLSNSDAYLSLLNRIYSELEKPFALSDRELSLTCSIGIALYPQDGDSFDTLLSHANMAMYEAKQAGRNTYRYFSSEMNSSLKESLTIAMGMSKALEQNQFELHYQPQIDLQTGRLIGAESLIRWQHPELGMIPPNKFIPIAEENGMIVPIGRWVLQEACRQVKTLQQMGLEDAIIAVNLSAIQFNSGDIEHTVREAIELAGVPANRLELEMTESIIMKDAENVLEKVVRLQEMGCHLSIDDFGTGYSSLAYLKRFAVDKLKIDQAFIKDMAHNQDDDVIVRTIIQMAKNLGLKTIAEGIEDAETLALLKQYQCDEAQGYFIARPMNEAKFHEFIHHYNKAS